MTDMWLALFFSAAFAASPQHPASENLNPKATGPQYGALLSAIGHWPGRSLAPPGAESRVSVRLVAYETPGHPHAIGVGQSMLLNAPLASVKSIMEDFEHYHQLFFDFKDVHVEERDGNRVVTYWEQSIPLPFVPNTTYSTYFYILDSNADRVFYRYQLKASNSLTYSDGLIVLERAGPGATRYTEFDFFDADWGIAASLAPARIWRDSLRGVYYSDIAIKLRAEHPDWSYDQIRRESKKRWEDEYSDDAVSDLLKGKSGF